MIIYPDCTNYEGKKVMIFRGSSDELKRRTIIDPHFFEDNTSTIARFEPTESGWLVALETAKIIDSEVR